MHEVKVWKPSTRLLYLVLSAIFAVALLGTPDVVTDRLGTAVAAAGLWLWWFTIHTGDRRPPHRKRDGDSDSDRVAS